VPQIDEAAAKERSMRFVAETCKAHSHTVEVAGASHSVYVSHSRDVADAIESAARAVSK
jgi:hypothetical protein